MNLQDYITNAIETARSKRLEFSDQLTVGEIIKKLEPIVKNQKDRDSDATVTYDFEYLFPTHIDSWRGSYSELALNFSSHEGDASPMTVTDFLSMMKWVIGKSFEGYKGGDYIMSENTPVWVANYGNSGSTAVIDIVDNEYEVIIITGRRDY